MAGKCVHCGTKAVSRVELPEYETQLEHDGRSYNVRLRNFSVYQCAHCNELALDDDATDRLVESLRAEAGIMSAHEIKRRRIELGFTQKRMAGLLQISESTLSRWETGAQLQQRCMDLLLRAFFAMPSFREFANDPAKYIEESDPSPVCLAFSQHVSFKRRDWNWTKSVTQAPAPVAPPASGGGAEGELVA